MKHLNHRLPENVAGRFYVSDDCISCGLCGNDQPEVFMAHENAGFHFVHRQPVGDAESAETLRVAQRCPVDAIQDSLSAGG